MCARCYDPQQQLLKPKDRMGLKLPLFVFFAAASIGVFACSCVKVPRLPCQDLANLESVFLGQVVALGPGLNSLLWQLRAQMSPAELAVADSAEGLPTGDLKRIAKRVVARRFWPKLQTAKDENEVFRLLLKATGSDPSVEETWADFRVSEVLHGTHHEVQRIWVPQLAGSCGFLFDPGVTYLVKASWDEGAKRLATNVCHGTRELSSAIEEVTAMRLLTRGGEPDAVFGIVTTSLDEYRTLSLTPGVRSAQHGLRGVTLALRSASEERTATTGPSGEFSFGPVKPGVYRLAARKEGYDFPGLPPTIKVGPRACVPLGIHALPSPGLHRYH